MIDALAEMFSYPFNQRALLASLMIGFMNGFAGGYVVLRRGALFAGALSNTLFPGVAVGALVAGLNPYSALAGAFIMALVIGLSSEGVAVHSRIDRDAALAVLYTASAAGGMMILSRLGTFVRVEDYLFGNILRISNWDLWFIHGAGLLVISVLVLLQRPLLMFVFSSDLAAAQGVPVKALDYLLAAVVVVTMVTSLQAAGALLAIGLLVAPAASLYLVTNSPSLILWGGGVLGAVMAVAALVITNVVDLQTGPTLLIMLGGLFLAAFGASLVRARVRPSS